MGISIHPVGGNQPACRGVVLRGFGVGDHVSLQCHRCAGNNIPINMRFDRAIGVGIHQNHANCQHATRGALGFGVGFLAAAAGQADGAAGAEGSIGNGIDGRGRDSIDVNTIPAENAAAGGYTFDIRAIGFPRAILNNCAAGGEVVQRAQMDAAPSGGDCGPGADFCLNIGFDFGIGQGCTNGGDQPDGDGFGICGGVAFGIGVNIDRAGQAGQTAAVIDIGFDSRAGMGVHVQAVAAHKSATRGGVVGGISIGDDFGFNGQVAAASDIAGDIGLDRAIGICIHQNHANANHTHGDTLANRIGVVAAEGLQCNGASGVQCAIGISVDGRGSGGIHVHTVTRQNAAAGGHAIDIRAFRLAGSIINFHATAGHIMQSLDGNCAAGGLDRAAAGVGVDGW